MVFYIDRYLKGQPYQEQQLGKKEIKEVSILFLISINILLLASRTGNNTKNTYLILHWACNPAEQL